MESAVYSTTEDSMKLDNIKMENADVAIGHIMSLSDPDNPQNWPSYRKIYVSAVSFAFAFVVAFGATIYTAGISDVISSFDVSYTTAILGLSLYLFGIAGAPVITPHLSEAFGRSTVYLICLPIFSLFILGTGLSQTFASLAVCRFFAGLTGGPCLVLIEGTFADVWSADATNTYYAVLSMASFVGTGAGTISLPFVVLPPQKLTLMSFCTGPLVGGFIFASTGWRWTQWVTLMLTLAVFLFGIGMPETYPRQVLKRKHKKLGISPPNLAPAGSGITLHGMLQVTFLTPLTMLLTEPVVVLCTLYLGFNFAVIFSFFISIPVVLHGVYGFSIQQVGLAFIAAITGSILAASTSILIDRFTVRAWRKSGPGGIPALESRLYPAMAGGIAITISLLWIGWTASPTIRWPSPVLGTLLYVWGNQSVLSSLIPYIFDAYPPAGTLSALTAAASVRLALAAFLPLVILQMFTNLTGAWALSLLGFLAAAMVPIPWVLYKWGAQLRAKSKHGHEKMGVKQMGRLTRERDGEGISSVRMWGPRRF
ncbi:hypothetical protein MMC32_008225 [Xylographa parallela]|nr:hypothetical protein [Xylographa parallela]